MGWGPTGCGQLEMTAVVLGCDAAIFYDSDSCAQQPKGEACGSGMLCHHQLYSFC